MDISFQFVSFFASLPFSRRFFLQSIPLSRSCNAGFVRDVEFNILTPLTIGYFFMSLLLGYYYSRGDPNGVAALSPFLYRHFKKKITSLTRLRPSPRKERIRRDQRISNARAVKHRRAVSIPPMWTRELTGSTCRLVSASSTVPEKREGQKKNTRRSLVRFRVAPLITGVKHVLSFPMAVAYTLCIWLLQQDSLCSDRSLLSRRLAIDLFYFDT